MTQRRIAVVGSGIAGLTAAHVLQKDAAVTLFEADGRLGGHAHTHDLLDTAGAMQRVDTGFIVHNVRTYPTLLRLFAELGVATQDSDMSMSIRCDGCGLEYAGARGLGGLFPTVSNLRRPRYVAMLAEVTRFHRRARTLLADDAAGEPTLSQFLADGRFSAYFRAHFMTPMVAAVWSTSPATALEYPARYLFAFLNNHGMLSVTGTPQWRTVSGGSQRYVERLVKQLSAVEASTPIRSVARVEHGVEIRDDADTVSTFDAVVVATHPHQALNMLTAPTDAERDVLGAIRYTRNPTILHTDTSVLPDAARAQASWNYRLPGCDVVPERVNVSYDMNRLQALDSSTRYLVTLNDQGQVDPSSVLDRMDYEHPIYTPESVAAQKRLPELSGGRIAFAGAYHGWGFHEDGAVSGLNAARALGSRW